MLKKDFKSTSISFARDRRKELSRGKVLLTNRLIVLKRRLASGISAVSSEILELEASLKSIFDRELERVLKSEVVLSGWRKVRPPLGFSLG